MGDMIDRDAVLKIVTRDRVYNGSSFRVVSTQELIDAIRAIPAAAARAEALKEAAAVAAKFDSDGMYGAAAIHDAILALAPTSTTR